MIDVHFRWRNGLRTGHALPPPEWIDRGNHVQCRCISSPLIDPDAQYMMYDKPVESNWSTIADLRADIEKLTNRIAANIAEEIAAELTGGKTALHDVRSRRWLDEALGGNE